MRTRRLILAALMLTFALGGAIVWYTNRVALPPVPIAAIAETAEPAVIQPTLPTPARRSSPRHAPRHVGAITASSCGLTTKMRPRSASRPPRNSTRPMAAGPISGGLGLTQSDPVAAIPWFRQALDKVPPDAQSTVRAALAESLTAAGEPAAALATLGATPTTPRERLAAARAAFDSDDDARAASLLSNLATEWPSRSVLALRARLLQKQGRGATAAELSRRASVAPEPEWPDPLAAVASDLDLSRAGRFDAAAKLLRENKPAEAEAILTRYLAGSPDGKPFQGLAEARLMRGDQAGAIRALEQGHAIEPNNVGINYLWGRTLFAAGEELWKLGRDDQARQLFTEALTHLDAALSTDPRFVKALLLKATACVRFLNRVNEGTTLLRRLIELRPEYADGHFYLGEALRDAGDLVGAGAEFRRAAELSPSGDQKAEKALNNLTDVKRNR